MGIDRAGIKLTDIIIGYGKRLIETKPYVPKGPLRYVTEPQTNGIGLIKSITKEEAKKMLTFCRIKPFSARDRQVALKINGQEVLGTWIEGGGSKCAYRVKLNGEEVCVLLPHANWGAAVNEPQNMLELKKLGLVTNDYCKIIPVEVNGTTIPALVSKPYDKHSFKIFDKKNPNDALEKYFDINKMSEENIEEIFTPLIKDIKTLIDNNIHLAYDSFNIALKDGKLRLYLNDLPYEKLVRKGNNDELFKIYTDYTTEAVAASFSWSAARKNPFVNSLGSIAGTDKIYPKLLDLYRKL